MLNFKHLVKNVRENTVFEELDIDELLSGLEDSSYLENKNLDDITREIFDIIGEHIEDSGLRVQLCDRLVGYRYVERVCDIRNGRNTRWIKGNKLHNGGISTNIRIGDNTTFILYAYFLFFYFVDKNNYS